MTADEARGIYAAGEGKVVETLLGQDCQIRVLKERLCTDSHNSSKPPSTDGYHKPEPKSRRVRTGRKPGGQKGHPGTTLVPGPRQPPLRRTSAPRCNTDRA